MSTLDAVGSDLSCTPPGDRFSFSAAGLTRSAASATPPLVQMSTVRAVGVPPECTPWSPAGAARASTGGSTRPSCAQSFGWQSPWESSRRSPASVSYAGVTKSRRHAWWCTVAHRPPPAPTALIFLSGVVHVHVHVHGMLRPCEDGGRKSTHPDVATRRVSQCLDGSEERGANGGVRVEEPQEVSLAVVVQHRRPASVPISPSTRRQRHTS
jgi:hypothetical protein